ncbi:MAG: hypothetical protein HC800_22320 [Phormidesmis sp. RL_2_1]|nr:hypothetical protein [Phormidesmis sp. RL_2_1]
MTTSSQNQTTQTAVIPSPAPAVCHQPDETALFFQLWLEQPSWSPIIKKADGWITIVNNSGKKVPLVLGTVESHYRRDIILGKRFGKLTNYLMIDIDINSPFHPRNGGIEQILAAMESLGLCRYLLIRSSVSEGIHIYFPLAEPVSAWGIACVAYAALTAAGVTIAGGTCELFPNKRALNAEHNGHRLPLQTGSFLLDKDFCPISNHKADFVSRWETAAAHQDTEKLQRAINGNAVYAVVPSTPVEPVVATQNIQTSTARVKHVIPPIAWTSTSQSNDVMRELVNYGDRYVGHKTIADLADWVRAVAPQLPGYEQFASPKSKRDIEHGTWPLRWAKSHFNSVYAYKVGGSDHNANVAHDAKARIFAALDLMCVTATISITELFKNIASIAKHCLNKGIHWNTLKKYEAEIWAYIKQAGELGLSRSSKEGINSFSSEPSEAQIIEPEFPGRKSYTELLTLRCVAGIYSSAFARIHTPKKAVGVGGVKVVKTEARLANELPTAEGDAMASDLSTSEGCETEVEGDYGSASVSKPLAAGQLVRIVMPGGSLDGIETQILAQTVDVLGLPVYRLDYRRQEQAITLPAECLQRVEAKNKALPEEAVIRATAAQLLQVLGKACPFVGPGLWQVKRDEVPATAWGQLCRLVGEV